jgi:hypothetical protein
MLKLVRALCLTACSLGSLTAWAAPDVWVGGVAPTPDPIFATSSGVLEAYYTAAMPGGLTVLVGVSVNGVDLPTLGLNNHASTYGDMLQLGSVNAGDKLEFFIQVVDGARYYTNPARNPDSFNHAWVSTYAGDIKVPAGTNIAFEDLSGGGDLNYRDHGITFRIAGAVPEPASALMMLLGVAGIAGLRRSKRR